MEIVYDENGNDITNDLRLIWMMDTLKVIGSLGTEKYFVKRKQYRYTSSVVTDLPPGWDPYYRTAPKEYFIWTAENGEVFYIDGGYCEVDDKPRKIWEQDETAWLQHKSDQPKDYIEEYKDLTGIDLEAQNMPVTNGGDALWQEHLKKRNEGQGKQYGQVELRQEFPEEE